MAMTLEELEEALNFWERLDGGWDADGETRRECAEVLTDSSESLAAWKEKLIKVPADIDVRYRRVVKRMLDAGLIDEAAADYELRAENRFSPADKLRWGKRFSALLKQHETLGLTAK